MIEWRGYDAGLAPGFAELITATVDPLPYTYVVTSGWRSGAQQTALFAQGRTTPGKIVTNARAGESPHNGGLAVDLYPLIAGLPDYGWSHGAPEPSGEALPAYRALWQAIANSGRLTSGASPSFLAAGLYDPGHIERTNWRAYVLPLGMATLPDVTIVSTGELTGDLPTVDDLPDFLPADPTSAPAGWGGGAPTPDFSGASPPPSSVDALDTFDPTLLVAGAVAVTLVVAIAAAARRASPR